MEESMVSRPQSVLLALWLVLWPTSSQALVVLSESFAGDAANFTHTSPWQGSYCKDGWRTDLNDGVIAGTDDSCTQCTCNYLVQSDGVNDCIGSEPLDNHIQAGNQNWQNVVYSVRLRNDDDDTMGVVFRYANSANFYLFTLARSSSPGADGCNSEFLGARLIRVRQGNGQLLKEVAGLTYEMGQVHAIRITAVERHLKIEFDLDGDGAYAPSELFFDQADDAQLYLPAGRVGLYAYNNGALESDNAQAPCAAGGCWFDDVVVDLLPPNNKDCGTTSFEGQCQGNLLTYCDKTGLLKTENCGPGACCGWSAQGSYFTCLPEALCAPCVDGCEAGQQGCSSNLSHTVTCAPQADGCLAPVLTACPAGAQCNPATGKCQTPCAPLCGGKECGGDGCGGLCGTCEEQQECLQGHCEDKVPGAMGAPCQTASDCATMMCVNGGGEKLCSKACNGNAGCPAGFLCQDATVAGTTIQACLPSGECIPDCTKKDCGSDGCDGQCGQCDAGFTCKGGTCLADAGATCKTPQDCASGLCISFQSGTFCSAPCSTDEGCPLSWHCGPWLDAVTPNICAPKGTMVAHESCAGVAECIDSCPNAACVSSCFFFGSTTAQHEYSALTLCLQTICQSLCDQDNACIGDCLLEACFQPFATCFPGEMTCSEAVACMGGCGGGQTCLDTCYAGAYPAAKKQLNELLDCVAAHCPDGAPGDCFQDAIGDPCLAPWTGCTEACLPVCNEAECGNDGCGGECGQCPPGQVCVVATCVIDCLPQCDSKDCGDDGCGGTCGQCAPQYTCIAGVCAADGDCVPMAERQCVDGNSTWFDSCGQPGDLAQTCVLGCEDGQCLAPPVTQEDVITLDDVATTPDTDPVTLSAATPSAGCSASGDTGPTLNFWPVLLLLAGLFWNRRSRHV